MRPSKHSFFFSFPHYSLESSRFDIKQFSGSSQRGEGSPTALWVNHPLLLVDERLVWAPLYLVRRVVQPVPLHHKHLPCEVLCASLELRPCSSLWDLLNLSLWAAALGPIPTLFSPTVLRPTHGG